RAVRGPRQAGGGWAGLSSSRSSVKDSYSSGQWPVVSKSMADGRWQMADGRWQMADGRWLPRSSLATLHSPLLPDLHWPLTTGHWPLFPSSRQLGDQGDQRQEEGDDDEADDAAEDDDHHRLEEADQRFHGHFHLFVVVVGDLVEHGVELAGLLAHVDHVDHDVVDDAGLAQGLGDRLALADAL